MLPVLWLSSVIRWIHCPILWSSVSPLTPLTNNIMLSTMTKFDPLRFALVQQKKHKEGGQARHPFCPILIQLLICLMAFLPGRILMPTRPTLTQLPPESNPKSRSTVSVDGVGSALCPGRHAECQKDSLLRWKFPDVRAVFTAAAEVSCNVVSPLEGFTSILVSSCAILRNHTVLEVSLGHLLVLRRL